MVGVILFCGGKCDGVMFEVILFENILCDIKVYCEEVFGLVVFFFRFIDFNVVFDEVNDSKFGL